MRALARRAPRDDSCTALIQACRGFATAPEIQFDSFPASDEPKHLAESQDNVLLVHGLLGSARNWRSFVRNLQKEASAQTSRPWHMATPDLRNHGRTWNTGQGFKAPHNLAAAARDLDTISHAGRSQWRMLIGHSLGGKVVLQYLKHLLGSSSTAVQGLPEQVWVLDAAIGQAKVGVEEPSDIDKVLQAVGNIRVPLDTREQLYQQLSEQGFSSGLQQWLGSNLVTVRDEAAGNEPKLDWTFSLEGAAAMYRSFQAAAYWDLLTSPPPGTTIHVVRAQDSDRWSEKAIAKLHKMDRGPGGQVQVHVLENAGHWLHVDNPRGLTSLLLSHMT